MKQTTYKDELKKWNYVYSHAKKNQTWRTTYS